MTTDVPARRSHRPRLRQTVAEAVALFDHPAMPSMDSMVAGAPRGDSHAVLVLPALCRGDPYTAGMRRLLTALGYTPYGWTLGVNIGPTRRSLAGVADRLATLSDRHGPVSLVGFSMGGLFARWLSLRTPDRVRQVVTVCSPMHEPARNFWLPLDPLLDLWPGIDVRALAEEIAQPLPVPGTFLFSRDDGLVNPDACWDPHAQPADNIEIDGPHVLIARNPKVWEIVAERLARTMPPAS